MVTANDKGSIRIQDSRDRQGYLPVRQGYLPSRQEEIGVCPQKGPPATFPMTAAAGRAAVCRVKSHLLENTFQHRKGISSVYLLALTKIQTYSQHLVKSEIKWAKKKVLLEGQREKI